MIIPPYLKKGSTIAIVATARFSDEKQISLSKKIIEDQGFRVVLASNISQEYKRFAGDDELRMASLQRVLDDTDVDAIWLARGGYGTVRIIDALDWTLFLQHPKWLVGFSDFTLVHLKMLELGCASIHACNFNQLPQFGLANENVITVIENLSGQHSKYNFKSSEYNKTGLAEGNVIGGNLSLICTSIGTTSEIKTKGAILMLEDCDEYLYHYDRLLHQLKRSGILKDLSGLIIGESTVKAEPDDIHFGFALEEIVLNICKDYDYPICFNAPFGHSSKNYALGLNLPYTLAIYKEEVSLTRH